MYNIDDIKATLKIRLSKKRFTHSINVADAAVRLAEKWGADKDKAYIAGLVHDICKEIPHQEQLIMARKSGFELTADEEAAPPLYHAPAGAYYARSVLGITDSDILGAIRFHTIGTENMSLLEEVIFLADLISEERDYKDAPKMRRLAFEDKDRAILEALRFQLPDVIGKASYLPAHTVKAYNHYLRIYLQKEDR